MDFGDDPLGGITYSDEQLLKEKGYQFVKQLGEGSYAKVYLTLHTKAGRNETATLACKVINAKKAPREYVTKFLPRELDILGKVAHPNIIHTDAIFNRNNKFLIFMRYAENGDLLEYVLRKGEAKESIARVWLYQLCLATQYLHVLDIAHRDIKCENILISANYNIKLADFGFARFVVASGKQVLSSTYCGSLIYASPEILKGKPYYPKCSDVWSIGIVTYVMLNKTMPFSETNTRQLYKLQMERQWQFRRKIAPLVTPGIISLVQKMLEPNFRARVTIDDIVTDRYFREHNLDMTDTEKTALAYANKHRTSLQTMKKVNLSDIQIYTEETEGYTSTVAVTQQTIGSTPQLGGSAPPNTQAHVVQVEHRETDEKEPPKPQPEEQPAATMIATRVRTESPAKSPVREAPVHRESPDDKLTTIASTGH